MSMLSRIFGRQARAEDSVARYVIAETAAGRMLGEVLADSYVENRLGHAGVRAILDRKDVIDAVGGDAVASLRARLGQSS